MKHYFFYLWNEEISEYRLMTSWDTTESDINDFISLLKEEIVKHSDTAIQESRKYPTRKIK
jgi:hypothetical protein